MEKVSVIIPVYNKEAYLGEAIESVLNQTYPELELLLIDDGSTDGSKGICAEYCKKDSRIVLLENNTQIHGPGPARNIGLDHAVGDYLYFMDADDWIDEKLLECAVASIQKTGADIAMVGLKMEREDGAVVSPNAWEGGHLLKREDMAQDIGKCCDIMKYFWLHLYRHETVRAIRFESIVNGEDLCYFADCLSAAQTIAFTDEVSYHYRYVMNSTSRQWNRNMINCRRNIWEHQRRFLDSLPGQVDPYFYAVAAYENYSWALCRMGMNLCPLPYSEKKSVLLELKNSMGFDTYRSLCPLQLRRGLWRIIYLMIKYHLDGWILLLGPVWCKMEETVWSLTRKKRKVE